jgi:siroheme synthase
VKGCQPSGPALLIIGDVVTLQPRLQWYGATATATPND